jgi:hypothetical protein
MFGEGGMCMGITADLQNRESQRDAASTIAASIRENVLNLPTELRAQMFSDFAQATQRQDIADMANVITHWAIGIQETLTPTIDELFAMSNEDRESHLSVIAKNMAALYQEYPELTEFNSLDREEL